MPLGRPTGDTTPARWSGASGEARAPVTSTQGGAAPGGTPPRGEVPPPAFPTREWRRRRPMSSRGSERQEVSRCQEPGPPVVVRGPVPEAPARQVLRVDLPRLQDATAERRAPRHGHGRAAGAGGRGGPALPLPQGLGGVRADPCEGAGLPSQDRDAWGAKRELGLAARGPRDVACSQDSAPAATVASAYPTYGPVENPMESPLRANS